MQSIASGLAERGIATLRYQFPYMEQRNKRPDPPKLAQATVRAAVAEAARSMPGLPLVAGGKSFGGRMTSQAQASTPLPGVRGLAFLGFPLHRNAHVEQVLAALGPRATLKLFDGADHSFHVPQRSGRTDAQTLAEVLDALAAWIDAVLGR